MTWYSLSHIKIVLQPFMKPNLNHALLPGRGGPDFREVESAAEVGCLSFTVEERMADIGKPTLLILAYISAAPAESFLLLELATLQPSPGNKHVAEEKEEVVEYPRGIYLNGEL
jgi:hypothetical protein